MWRSEGLCRRYFSPSTMWVPGLEFRSSTVAGTFAYWSTMPLLSLISYLLFCSFLFQIISLPVLFLVLYMEYYSSTYISASLCFYAINLLIYLWLFSICYFHSLWFVTNLCFPVIHSFFSNYFDIWFSSQHTLQCSPPSHCQHHVSEARPSALCKWFHKGDIKLKLNFNI